MDLLREVASDRLVIMVTHNPELAEQYATRIVELSNGRVISNTRPYAFNISENQDNNTNPFYPIEKGAEFACKLRFFNLKEIKLGALLNSVSLNEGYYYSIGFAKPFGYGKIFISIENIHPSYNIDIQEYKQIFVAFMSEEVDNYQRSE